MPTCAECGSTKVVQDDLYSEATLVCEDCGSIVPFQQLATTRSEEEQGTSVPYYASTEVTKQPSRNLIKGIKRVQALCRIYRFSGDLEAMTTELYKRAYTHPDFLMARMEKKEVLGGACMLAVARMNSKPVTMGTISALLEADSTSLVIVYRELVRSLQLQVNGTAITDMLENYCHGLNLTAEAVGEAYSEKSTHLTERATALLELAGETWLVTGRNPIRMCLAVAFLAWQSFRPALRMKVPLSEFCRLTKTLEGQTKSPALVARVKELREVLCKLGAQLPWLRGKPVTPQKVAALVEDIVKYRRLLLAKTLRSHEEALEAEDAKKNAAGAADGEKMTTCITDASSITTDASGDHTLSGTSALAKNGLEPSMNVPESVNTTSTVPHDIPTQSQHTQLTAHMTVPAKTNPTAASVSAALPSATPTPTLVGSTVPVTALSGTPQGEVRADHSKAAGRKRKAEEMMGTTTSSSGTEETDALKTHGHGIEEEGSSSDEEESDCSDAELPPDHWSKRQLFVPPCVLNPKRKMPRAEQGPDVTGDEEISDSEIESYLRSPQETRDFSQAQKYIAQEEAFREQMAEQKMD